MRLVLLPSHFDGDGFYRLLFPAHELRRQHGFEVAVGPHVVERTSPLNLVVHYGHWLSDGREARLARSIFDWLLAAEFDVLLMQQRMEPEWADFYPRLQAQGKRVLVDSDDAWIGLPSWNPGSRKKAGEVGAMLRQIRAADGLSVATPALADMYREYQPNVRVLRNRLDWAMWADVVPAYEVDRRRVRVGWMGDTKWRAGDLRVLRGVIGPWLERHPEVEFVAAGDPRAHDLLGVPVRQRVSVGKVAFANGDLADITATFDIGLVPLATDPKARVLNECKSHLKGAEYNACGIPYVATPTESYRWYTREGSNGFLASTPSQWKAHLTALLDGGLRRRMGWEARELARRNTIVEGADEWREWVSGGVDRHVAVAAAAA